MGQNKDQLKKLLKFVEELYNNSDNKEFAAGINAMVMADKDFQRSLSQLSIGSSQIDRIEKYLSLDFDIDNMSFPDYSFIDDESIRNKLNSDFREMLRYQYGTRNHRIDFDEFCRYATLQIELLVNYYYEKHYKCDVYSFKTALLSHNQNFTLSPYIATITDIPLKTKVFQLRNEFDLKGHEIQDYLHAIDIRNRQSHRGLKHDKDIISETEKKLEKENFLTKWGTLNYSKIEEAKALIGEKVLNEYQFQKWYDEQPFIKVIKSVRRLANKIRSFLLDSEE